MKKQDLVNLIRYHVENNNDAFIAQVAKIANDFNKTGDEQIASYLMDLISDTNYYYPQYAYNSLKFLKKIEYSNNSLFLPDVIEEDVLGIVRSIQRKSDLSRFLFYGAPGTGKTESTYQIARLLNLNILSIDFEQLVDSRLGETAKNVVMLFDEINHLPYDKSIIVFDEIDALALDRINKNDIREMGRVTSVFLRELERLKKGRTIIATTNLFNSIDKAMIRRFDAVISFNRYTREDLVKISDELLKTALHRQKYFKQDLRLFHKIIDNIDPIPYPADMKQIIRNAVLFSDDSNSYDYLRRIYMTFHSGTKIDLQQLSKEGFTVREIEMLTSVPRSSVSRKLRGR